MDARKRRAVALIALSVTAVAVLAVVYVQPSLPALPRFGVAALPSPSPPTHTPADETVSFDFLDPMDGWAAASLLGTSTRLWTYATTDGGRSWRPTGAIDGLAVTYPVRVFRFFDRRDGVIAVGPDELTAYRTVDGGQTWTRMPLPAQTWFLTFADPAHGWATTPFAGPGSMRVSATYNGGLGWIGLPDLPVQGIVDFASPSDGWLGGPPGTSLVYRSVDGGLSWNPIVLPAPPDCALQRAGCQPGYGPRGAGPISGTTDDITTLPHQGVVVLNHDLNTMFASTDAGASWHFVALPAASDYSEISFFDATHWWLVASNTLYKTTDAGLSWTASSTRIIFERFNPTILDERHAWAEIQTADDSVPGTRPPVVWELEVTSDGGASWKLATVPVPT